MIRSAWGAVIRSAGRAGGAVIRGAVLGAKMEMKAGASSGMGRIKGSFIFQSGYQLQSSCQSFENVALLELAGAAAGALSAA